MKLKIEKLPTGKVLVEVATGPGRAIKFELDPAQVHALADLLPVAARADRFCFVLEL